MMKKLFLLASLSIMVLGCSDEIQTNTPVIQGKVNDQFFRAKPATGSIQPDGSVKLIGTHDSRTITLKMASTNVGQYPLVDTIPENQATFLSFQDELYIAGAGIGSGMIEITGNSGSSLSGTFFFNAVNSEGDILNFRKGVFFEVPIIGSGGDDDGDGTVDFLTADIDDVPFEASVITVEESAGNITVLGATQNTSIQLIFPTEIAAGDYELTADGEQTASYSVNLTMESVESGSMTINSNNAETNTIEGSFEFTTEVSGTVITNGSFQITYQ